MSGWTIVDRNTNKSLPWTGSGSEQAGYIAPSPGTQDPVGKMRMSQPQSLIDTDFEYGQQPTKWETIALQNNRQSMYYLPQQSAPVTAVNGNGTTTVTVLMSNTANFVIGNPIFVQNALDPNANGWYFVQSVSTNVSVTYTAAGVVANGNQFNAALTFVYPGYFYSACGMPLSSGTAFTYVGTTISCTTTSAHGLDAGSFIFVRNVTSVAANAVNGWISGTVLSFNAQPGAGLALRTGYFVTGAGVTANTTITAVNNVSFTADITGGTTLTRTAGTVPTVGMQLVGTGITPGTYILSGVDPTFTLSAAATNGTAIATTGTNYTVNNSQTVGAIGTPVALTVSSGAVADAPNGAWQVATVPTANTLTFTVFNTPFGTLTNIANNTTLLARPSGFVESRSFDGGVAFSAGAIAPNQQLIRQTRRYFRYQSGKGLQFSTGTSLKPPLFVTSITGSGATATVTTRFPHCMGVGATVIVEGCEQAGYNGTFTIATVPTPTTFTYQMAIVPAITTATGFPIRVIPNTWWGSSNRIGMFDLQNGLFFEYDGQQLYAVWRNSVIQISGTSTVTVGSSQVNGTGTQYSSQLKPGDWIVIRGQSYRVQSISSDTSMLINPEYRGTTLTQGGCLISKTVDTRVPQSQWTDRLDGTGPSGYRLDLSKMQMFYIEYSWYGAGFARWGLRTTNGQIAYVYQQTNNNLRFEAYLRSGNMAAHYESNGTSPKTFLTSTLGTGGVGTAIFVDNAESFAPSGTVKISNPGAAGTIEYITYTKVSNNRLNVALRAQAGGQGAAQTFTVAATAPVQVEFVSPDSNAPLSHWGSSVIMDGRFDDDKSLVFNYGMTTAVSTSSVSPIVLMALRIAPSVDNNTTGLLGAKEIVNRMQLTLDSLGLYTTGTGYLINLVLNGFASGSGFASGFVAPIQQANGITSSLAQIALNTSAITVTGGESVYAGYTNPTGVTTLNLTGVRDLGNSILGGGTSNSVPTAQAGFYPDGPDILYVVATPLSATASTILARINWKEAQA